MDILVVLGSLGSGKTTLVNALLPLLAGKRTLVIVNDVGVVNVDARRLSSAGQVKALTAGCIGCNDLPAFRTALQEAHDAGVDTLIIEPTGIADGNEIAEAVNELGLAFSCISLLDVKHFARNRALNTLPSQLAVASVVALTWCEEDIVSWSADHPVNAFIGRHAPGRPVLTLRDADDAATALIAATQQKTSVATKKKCGCAGHGCGHHDHDHSHNHGVYACSVSLRQDCTFAALTLAVAPHLSTLVRAKGVVGGYEFDFVQGDIQITGTSTEPAHANFISTSPISPDMFLDIALQAHDDTRNKKARLRASDDVSLQDTVAAIEWLLPQYPPVITPNGMLRVDCEFDAAYQLAKRDGVSVEIWQQALEKFLQWRVESARVLREKETKCPAWQPLLAYWKRRLGANLAWHAHTYPDDINPTTYAAIVEIDPTTMLLEGLEGLRSLGFDNELAEERPELVGEAITFGVTKCELRRGKGTYAYRVVRHCLRLAEDGGVPMRDWVGRWHNVLLPLMTEEEAVT